MIVFIPHPLAINILEYSAICLCFISGLVFFLKMKSHLTFFIFGGLLFTLVADTFLVLLNAYLNYAFQCIAMTSFSICQIFYLLAIQSISKSSRERWINLGVRIFLFIAFEIAALIIVFPSFNYLVFISLFYFSQLIASIIFSFFHIKSHPFLAIGLLLFIGCDIFIGLYYLVDILALPSTHFLAIFTSYNFNYAWLFYLPSQVLLSLSGRVFVRRQL